MLAQCVQQDLVLGQFPGCLVKRAGQLRNTQLHQAALAKVIDIFLNRVWRPHILLYAVQTGGEHDGEGKVGVAAWIGKT